MKITATILAAVCILFVVLAISIPIKKPPLLEFWWAGAIKDADEIIAKSGDTHTLDGMPLTIGRGDLILLTQRAKEPDVWEEQVQHFRWSSIGFALVAGVSLYMLGRRQRDEHSHPPNTALEPTPTAPSAAARKLWRDR